MNTLEALEAGCHRTKLDIKSFYISAEGGVVGPKLPDEPFS